MRGIDLDVGFCFYEKSLETVKRSIESVRNHVRLIYAIDGKFEFFNSKDELSSPEVRDYLKSVPNVELIDFPNRKENEKRQVYLQRCRVMMPDFLLILDADEFIGERTNWEEFYGEMQMVKGQSILPKIWGINIQSGDKDAFYPRLWQNPHLIEYMKTHNFWKFKDGRIFKSTISNPSLVNLFIRQNDKLRDEEYLKESYKYQKKLMAYEKPYKEKYRKVAENTSDVKYRSRFGSDVPFA